ncbi:MAG TPA: hypothetical protein GXX15_13115 [Clostridia bacterium]|nr:hypothetical protein [Clostridia bacterium]
MEEIKEGFPETIFSDKNLYTKDLRKPIILELYEILKEKGIVKKNKAPRNVGELRKLIE